MKLDRLSLAALLSLALAACGTGGNNGDGTTPTPPTPTARYTATGSANTGGSIAPGSVTVDAGSTATFTLTAASGYSIGTVSGCGGTLAGSTYTTAAMSADCAVSAQFIADEPPPPTNYTATATAGSGGSITPPAQTVAAGATASFTVTADTGYFIATVSGCGGTLAGSSYTTAAMTADCAITASFEADAPAPAAIPMNDTGMVFCGLASTNRDTSGDNLKRCSGDASVLFAAQQDGTRGRDAQAGSGTLVKIGASTPNANLSPALSNGFDYTKIAGDGSELPADAPFWSCIRDNVTGLIWENKTDEHDPNIPSGADRGDIEGRDKDNTYSWYDPEPTSNGGNAGTAANGVCAPAGQCDTVKAIATRNAQQLCGASDWRMPDIDELQSLIDHGRRWGAEPELSSMVDPGYFSHTQWFNATAYWSSTTTSDSTRVWGINLADGRRGALRKTTNASLRLVRKPAPATR